MKRKSKLRRVRKYKDGSFNQEDIDNNQKSRDLYELQDNPWMADVFTKKKLSPYDKFLKKSIQKNKKLTKQIQKKLKRKTKKSRRTRR